MSEPIRRVDAGRPSGSDGVRAVHRVAERSREEREDRSREEQPRGERPAPSAPRPEGPDAEGHVDLLA